MLNLKLQCVSNTILVYGKQTCSFKFVLTCIHKQYHQYFLSHNGTYQTGIGHTLPIIYGSIIYFPDSETQIVEIINFFYPTDFPPRRQYLPCDITMASITWHDIVDTISTQRIVSETVSQQMYFLFYVCFVLQYTRKCPKIRVY